MVLADDQANGDVLWALTDNLGSVRDLVEYDGTSTQVVDHIQYDSFGNPTDSNAVDYHFGFTGFERDAESALNHSRTRYYDPFTGGWTSEDPIAFSSR